MVKTTSGARELLKGHTTSTLNPAIESIMNGIVSGPKKSQRSPRPFLPIALEKLKLATIAQLLQRKVSAFAGFQTVTFISLDTKMTGSPP
jgi:hypothetical protein